MTKKTETFTTRWGVAGELEPAMLEHAARTLDARRTSRWKVITGTNGFSALFFGDDEADDSFAANLSSAAKKRVFLLDFHDEGSSVTEIDGRKQTRKRGHPVEFLRKHIIVAPGFEPRPPSGVRLAYVVVGADPATIAKAYSNPSLVFEAHPKGALVRGDARGGESAWLERTKATIYGLGFNPKNGTFWCYIEAPNAKTKKFSTSTITNAELFEILDNVLGETTPDGILKALGVPRHCLLPDD